MKIAVLSHAPPGTGTYTSSHRIAAHFVAGGHQVAVVEHWDADVDGAAERREIHSADLLIGTHAVQSGRVFIQTGQPFVLVLSGTDLNLGAESDEADHAVRRAARLVAYDEHHLEKARQRWPEAESKLRLIRKGVQTEPSGFSLRQHLGLEDDVTLCLLPSGLRPVKDVLYLADEFGRWDAQSPKRRLIIVGLPRDPGYVELVHQYCASAAAVDVIPPLRQSDLHSAMREADVVINSSVSESSPNAVLEAMHVGACVVVRDIPGNRSLIANDEHGLLFRAPAEFRELVDGLTVEISQRLRTAASTYATQHHSMDQERIAYLQLAGDVVG